MAATAALRVLTGAAPGSATDIDGDNLRFNTADTVANDGTTNCLVKPAAGSYYSYWKHIRLEVTGGTFTDVNNLRFYTDGVNSSPSGVFWWGQLANNGADEGYREATGTPGTTGDQLTSSSHDGLIANVVDIFEWTSAAPVALTGSVSSADFVGDFVVLQVEVASTLAETGAIAAEPFTMLYDEV